MSRTTCSGRENASHRINGASRPTRTDTEMSCPAPSCRNLFSLGKIGCWVDFQHRFAPVVRDRAASHVIPLPLSIADRLD